LKNPGGFCWALADKVFERSIEGKRSLDAVKMNAAATKSYGVTRDQFPVMLLTTERQNHHSQRYLSTTEARLRWLAESAKFVTG
jgi:hypothetical protein